MKPRIPTSTDALAGWTVVCLRERRQQPAAARLIRACGARPLALPGLKLTALPAQAELDAALSTRIEVAVFTSPAAVEFAHRLRADLAAQIALAAAVGAGTAQALRQAGFTAVIQPGAASEQTSEGLLGCAELATGHGRQLLLISAPGGRGLVAPELSARGFAVQRIDVYRRGPARLDARHRRALDAATLPFGLLLSSAEALDNVLAQLPTASVAQLRQAQVAASSARLLAHAQARGFADVRRAAGPSTAALLAALSA
jgi:uroporphyrinogen-III synthase